MPEVELVAPRSISNEVLIELCVFTLTLSCLIDIGRGKRL